MTLGNVISEFRNLNNLTMEEFSKMAGLSKSYISMLERNRDPRGNAINPSIEVMDKVANAIGVDLDTLMNSIDQDIIVNTSAQKSSSEWLDSLDTDADAKWKFFKYCYDHASKEERERVLSILKIKEKWEEFKEISQLFTQN